MAEQIVMKACVDPDFGALQLIETRTMAGDSGGPMRPLVMRYWYNPADASGSSILISDGHDPLQVGENVRKDFRRVAGDIDGLKAHVAQTELALAKEWAESGELDIELTEKSFAELLVLDGYSIDPGRVTVWLSETADIFAGHLIEVRIEGGSITEICLAG